jgi:hypothetical protein
MIRNYLAWGKLVQHWALGDDPAFPIPRDLEELTRQCAAMATQLNLDIATGPKWEAIIKLPDTIKGMAVLQNTSEVLAIRLPAKSALNDVMAGLNPPPGQLSQDYDLPAFYSEQFGNAELDFKETGNDGKRADKLAFLAKRIGDYSVSNCA